MPLDGTLYEDETLRVLRAAQERIRNPENWCIGVLAQDGTGYPTDATSPDAVKFCARGALEAVGADSYGSNAAHYLTQAAREVGYENPAILNNKTDQPTTYAMFDLAQELRTAEMVEAGELVT